MNKNRTIRWLIFGILVLTFSVASFAQIGVGISVSFGPPPLPVYAQPLCPGPGYLWTPGYWAWSDDDGYYWVPGTWVVAPVGLLWTPGYWGWVDGAYLWNDGYWGPEVGFYGGINYGFGYTGEGFYGGEWRGGAFYYNRTVMNVSRTNITNVYNRTVVINNNHVAFNGGEGGVRARPTPEQERFAHEHHTEPLPAQRQQVAAASRNRALLASQNHGRPAIAATAKPGDFKSHVIAAKAAGGAYRPPAISPREARVNRTTRQPSGENVRQQAQQRKAEQKNTERQQAERQKTEQKNAQRQQAQQRKVEQKNTERQQQAQRQTAQQRPAPQHEQQPMRRAEQKRSEKPEKGPGR